MKTYKEADEEEDMKIWNRDEDRRTYEVDRDEDKFPSFSKPDIRL